MKWSWMMAMVFLAMGLSGMAQGGLSMPSASRYINGSLDSRGLVAQAEGVHAAGDALPGLSLGSSRESTLIDCNGFDAESWSGWSAPVYSINSRPQRGVAFRPAKPTARVQRILPLGMAIDNSVAGSGLSGSDAPHPIFTDLPWGHSHVVSVPLPALAWDDEPLQPGLGEIGRCSDTRCHPHPAPIPAPAALPLAVAGVFLLRRYRLTRRVATARF